MDIGTFQRSVERIAARTAALAADFDARDSDPELASVAAELRAVVADIHDRRTELDTIDVMGAATDPKTIIDVTVWERQTRWRLAQLLAHASIVARSINLQTTGGAVRQRVHVVREGDSLLTIAATTLGGWEQWIEIARVNSLDPGRPLVVGAQLILPEPSRVRS